MMPTEIPQHKGNTVAETRGSDDDQRSTALGRSAPRSYDPESSRGPYYNDAHRRPFRRRGGFARWHGNHGRTGDLIQAERSIRIVAALGETGFNVNAAAKLVGCSWHTVNTEYRRLLHTRSPGRERRERWLQRERKVMSVLKWRMAGKTFREISKRTGVPLSTCHRWWHFEMGD